jgi:DNA-binding PadR family transcriptional regulator
MAGETLKGASHLDLLLLACVRDGPQHGYAIIDALRERSRGWFDLPEGTVYPALHRLEDTRLLASRWVDGSPRPRRVYALTPAGRKALARRDREWVDFVASVGAVLGN